MTFDEGFPSSAPDRLEGLIDTAITDLLSLSKDLRTVDGNGKPAITPKDLTEALKVAIDWWTAKHGPTDEGWGSKLTPGGKAAA